MSAALVAKSERDPKTLLSLRASLHFDCSKPEDYQGIGRLLEQHRLKNIFWGFVESGMNDNHDLLHLGHTLAPYFNCVGRRKEAQDILDACLEMFPALFPKESDESCRVMASLLHERFGPAAGKQLAGTLPLNLAAAEDALIQRALDETGGNIAEAARLLGVHRTRIYRKLAQEESAGR